SGLDLNPHTRMAGIRPSPELTDVDIFTQNPGLDGAQLSDLLTENIHSGHLVRRQESQEKLAFRPERGPTYFQPKVVVDSVVCCTLM
ncbi:hypothetical protein GN956_G26118, partial [Arapaima gigas]